MNTQDRIVTLTFELSCCGYF